jgi:cytochrome c-type biogenesis protein CcmH/NrfG
LLVESGEVGKGKPKLEGAVQREPNNPSFVYHLAAARARSGDKGMAIRDLTQLLGSKQDFDERRAAEQLLKSLSDR